MLFVYFKILFEIKKILLKCVLLGNDNLSFYPGNVIAGTGARYCKQPYRFHLFSLIYTNGYLL